MINGLVGPEVVVRKGSRLEVTLVNESLRGSATFAIVRGGPPFPAQPVNPDPFKLAFRQHIPGFVAPLTYPLPRSRANGYTVYGARLVCEVRSVGAAWYLSNFSGAANAGEYGKILIVP